MQTYNLQDAQTHLSSLVEQCSKGEIITIVVNGQPLAKLVPVQPKKTKKQRLGFLQDQINVPADFDQMASDAISNMFLSL